MAFWIREATLVIGNKKYTLGELDFEFSIPFDDSDEPPVATVTMRQRLQTMGHQPSCGTARRQERPSARALSHAFCGISLISRCVSCRFR